MSAYPYLISSFPDFRQIGQTAVLNEWVECIRRNLRPADREAAECIFQRYDLLNLYHALLRSQWGIQTPQHRGQVSLPGEELLPSSGQIDTRPEFIQQFFLKHGKRLDQLNPFEMAQALFQSFNDHAEKCCTMELNDLFILEENLRMSVQYYHAQRHPENANQLDVPKDIQWLKPGNQPSEALEKEYPGLINLWKSLEESKLWSQDDLLQEIVIQRAFSLASAQPYGSMHVFANCFVLLAAYRKAEIMETDESPLEYHLEALLQPISLSI